MIVGLGVDIIDIARIERSIDRWGDAFLARVFDSVERTYCRGAADESSRFAARFAAKEALVKALGGWHGLSWTDIVVVHGTEGNPRYAERDALQQVLSRRNVERLHLSLSHSRSSAVACVVAEAS